MTKSLTTTSQGPRAISGLSFSEQAVFQGNVLRAVGGGAVGALTADVLARLFGAGTPAFSALVIAVSTGALAAIAGRGKSWLRAAFGGALGLAGGILHTMSTPAWPWFGALLLGAAAAPVLAKGESAGRMAVTGVTTGFLAFAGLYVAQVLQAKGILAGAMPGPLATALAGGAAGLFLGLGSMPKHLVAAEDPVIAAYRRALLRRDGEVHEILNRAFRIYDAIREDLKTRASGSTERQLEGRVGELAFRILQISEQCRKIESDLGAAPAKELEDRIENLKQKAAATSDQTARATFLATVKSLESQRSSVESISRGLERVVARLHANVALLEKVRFSLVHARSADAEQMGGESSPLAETIDELSRALDATSLAVGEVFGAGAEIQALESNEAPSPRPALEAGFREELELPATTEAPVEAAIEGDDDTRPD